MVIIPGALAYSYIRMSTAIQLQGDSLRRQQDLSNRFAQKHGLILADDRTYNDIGVSAYRGKNQEEGALGRFLAAMEQQKIPRGSYLLVESFDRISRADVTKALTVFLNILNAGINVVTLIDDQVFHAENVDPTQLMMSIVHMARANEESRTKSLRLSAVWDAKRKNSNNTKLTKICPAWLELSKDRAEYKIIEDKAEIVRRIFDAAINGQGTEQIVKGLNSTGVNTLTNAKNWSPSYVTKILCSRAVFGEFHHHKFINGIRTPVGDPIEGYFPTVVDKSTFVRVQAGRNNRRAKGQGRTGPTKANLFTGIAKCGYCGSSMQLINKGRGPKGGKYLKCSNLVKGLKCTPGSWRYDFFEEAFLTYSYKIDFAYFLGGMKTDDKIAELEFECSALNETIETNNHALEREYRLIENPDIDVEYIGKKISERSAVLETLREDLLNTTKKLNDLKLKKTAKNDVAQLIDELRNADPPELLASRTKLAQGLKEVISEIEVFVAGMKTPEQFVNLDHVDKDYFSEWDNNPTFKISLRDGSDKLVVLNRKKKTQYLFEQTRDCTKGGLATVTYQRHSSGDFLSTDNRNVA